MGVSKTDLFTTSQNNIALIAKALAHPARVAIIEQLLLTNSCVNNHLVKELGLAQATISQHLKELKKVGIIQGSIEGNSISYCINQKVWVKISQDLRLFFDQNRTIEHNTCCD